MSKASFDPQGPIPAHVAFIMDGNRRWARQKLLPIIAGHRSGISRLKPLVEEGQRLGVRYMTFYAFSTENWLRPQDQVRELMDLFCETLRDKVQELHEHNICVRFIGDRSRLEPTLVHLMEQAELLTQANTGIHLIMALNYGARWDITQATRRLCESWALQGRSCAEMTEDDIAAHLATAGTPDPDLLVRTSKEHRVSNFLLWQIAYTELYFTDTFWPDFDILQFHHALAAYQNRDRRLGG